MKKIIPIIFILIAATGYSQDNYMALSFGVGIPKSDFGKSDNLAKDGFAEQGFSGEYTGLYLLTDFFGIGGNIKFSSNAVNQIKLRNRFEDEIPEDLPFDSLAITTNIGSWKQVSLMVGPHFTLPVSIMNIDAYALAGINFIMAPKMEISAVLDNEWYLREFTGNTVSYAVDLGIALRFHLSEDYSLRIFSSYFLSKSNGKYREELSEGAGASSSEIDFSGNIQSIHAGIGIVYRL